MELQALASGSSGNAYLVRHGRHSLLVDAGISPRRLTSLLEAESVRPGDLMGVLVSHEHADHVRGAIGIAQRFQAPIVASRGTLGAIGCPTDVEQIVIRSGCRLELGALEIWPVGVSHDATEPLAFRLASGDAHCCIATDFGRSDDQLAEAMRDVDVAVLEANHDEQWLWNGHYPWFLKNRVASDVGHLSNVAAAELLIALADRAPTTVWLAHLSVHNNSPALALETIGLQLQRAGRTDIVLRVAARDRPSLQWSALPDPEQLTLDLV